MASTHPLYNRWRYIQDCLADRDTYESRSARKLKLTCEWATWASFRDDIEHTLGLPPHNQQLVRKDMRRGWLLNNLHYATTRQKGQLMRHCKYYTYKGKQYTLHELARICKLNYHTLYGRIERGWPIDAAVKIPKRKMNRAKRKKVQE